MLSPTLVLAQCSPVGKTVIYVNGILTSQEQAGQDLNELRKKFNQQTQTSDVVFINAYNPSHLAGVGDLLQSAAQLFYTSISDFDLQTMLRQVHEQLTTRKVLLVGHSQGSFYANSMYEYMQTHGDSAPATGVYNIASLAPYVAGGGKYLTLKRDLVVYFATDAAKHAGAAEPLPPNLNVMAANSADIHALFPGHELIDAYLADAPERVVGDLAESLSRLSVPSTTPAASGAEGCFSVPENTLGYAAQGALLSVADPIAQGVGTGAVLAYNGTVATGHAVAFIVGVVGSSVASTFNAIENAFSAKNIAPVGQTPEKDFSVVKSLYGSSLTQHEVNVLNNFANTNQGGVAVLALQQVLGTTTVRNVTPPSQAVSLPTTSSATSSAALFYPDHSYVTSGVQLDPEVVRTHEDMGATTTPPEATTTPPMPLPPEEEVPTEIFTATTTPPMVLVAECAYSLSDHVCVIATTTATLVWSAPPGAVRSSVRVNGSEVLRTSDLHAQVLLADAASSTIEVVSYDASSASATSSAVSLYASLHPVRISEVAWAGTNASPEDQWIELRDTTPYWLELRHVRMVSRTSGHVIPLEAVGSATAARFLALHFPTSTFGWYLFARVPGVMQDIPRLVVEPFDSLSPSGEELALVWDTDTGSTVLDTTPPVSACHGWCAGANAAHVRASEVVDSHGGVTLVPRTDTLTMERKEEVSGELASAWYSNDGYYKPDSPIYDRNYFPLLGTPGNTNSLSWPEAGFVCRVTGAYQGSLVLPNGTTASLSDCIIAAGFVADDSSWVSGFFDGVVGSSTLAKVYEPDSGPWKFPGIAMPLQPVAPNEKMFFAVWEYARPEDRANFLQYLTAGTELGLSPPHTNYRTIPFTYAP